MCIFVIYGMLLRCIFQPVGCCCLTIDEMNQRLEFCNEDGLLGLEPIECLSLIINHKGDVDCYTFFICVLFVYCFYTFFYKLCHFLFILYFCILLMC